MNPATLLLIGTGIVLLAAGARQAMMKTAAAKQPRYVVAIGDSLTAHGGYCHTLEQLLPAGSMVQCAGFVGEGVQKISDSVQNDLLESADDVIVLAGVNDLASGRGVSYTLEALENLYQRARARGANVIGVHLTPWAGHARGKVLQPETFEVNEWMERSPSLEVIVDTSALGDQAGYLLPEYSAGDGLHLNDVGQQRLGELIYQQVYLR